LFSNLMQFFVLFWKQCLADDAKIKPFEPSEVAKLKTVQMQTPQSEYYLVESIADATEKLRYI